MVNLTTPVVFSIFIRPEVAKEVFSVIREVKPSKLYLISDGPRTLVEESLVYENRKSIESMIDWDCNLTRIFFDTNLGIDEIIKKSFFKIFEIEDEIIFLEEDVIPSNSFFYFCQELLEKYRFDNRVYLISGMNRLSNYPTNSEQSYFFVDDCNYQGIAFWKRTFENFQYDLKIFNSHYLDELIKSRLKSKSNISSYYKAKYLFGNPNHKTLVGELFFGGLNDNVLFNSLAVVPSVNLIKPIGDTFRSENSDDTKVLPRRLRVWSEMKNEEIEFPLNHPQFLIMDNIYKAKVKKKFHINPLFKILIKIERGIRIIYFKGINEFVNKFQRFLKRRFYESIIYKRFDKRKK